MHVHFQETLRFCGAELHPLAVDAWGLRTEALWEWKDSPAFLCVTTSHQFPFGERCTVSGTAAGLHVVARFDEVVFDTGTLAALMAGGALLHPVERHAIRKGPYASHAMLSFGHLPESRIQEGVRRLRRILAPL